MSSFVLHLQVQAKYGEFNEDLHKPGFLHKERLLPHRLEGRIWVLGERGRVVRGNEHALADMHKRLGLSYNDAPLCSDPELFHSHIYATARNHL